MISAPASDEHCVVEISAAPSVVEDTVPVELELHVVGVDADGQGLLGQCCLHLVDIVCGDKGVVTHIYSSRA